MKRTMIATLSLLAPSVASADLVASLGGATSAMTATGLVIGGGVVGVMVTFKIIMMVVRIVRALNGASSYGQYERRRPYRGRRY